MSLAAAVTSLIYDGLKSIVDQTVYISSVGLIWENIPQSWVAALQPALESLADVWQGVIQSYLLEQPAWLVLGIIGAMMVWTKEEAADRTRTRSKWVPPRSRRLTAARVAHQRPGDFTRSRLGARLSAP